MGDDPNPLPRHAQISGPALYAAVGAIAALAGIGLGWGLWGRTPRQELVTPPPRQVATQQQAAPVAAGYPSPAPVVVQPIAAGPPTPSTQPNSAQTAAPIAVPETSPPAEAAPPPQPVPTQTQPPAAPVVTPAAPLPVSERPDPPAPNMTRRINVNTASQAELELLPGIGPALAQRIIDHRTQQGRFRTVDDLDAVKGIGPKVLERLRPLVSVD